MDRNLRDRSRLKDRNRLKDKNRLKDRNKFTKKLLKAIFFCVLAFLAIKLGIIGGNALSNMDLTMLGSVDAENFKTPLNNTFPIIDTVYNSGDINISISGEIQSFVEKVFGFDLNNPLSLLNVQSPFFYSYYNKIYIPRLAQQQEEKEPQRLPEKADEKEPDGEEKKIADNVPQQQEQTQVLEDESSIAYENEPELKPSPGEGVISSGKIVVQNETKYTINIEKLLKEPLKLLPKKNGPEILIYHTHTTESYLKNTSEINKKGVPSNSSDKKINVVRVGDELADILRKKYGFNVVHNATVNDFDYNKSYVNSLNTATRILKAYPSTRVVIDLHRDGRAIDKPKLRVVKKVNGKDAAQVMFVMGSHSANLSHPQWQENLKLALKLQNKLNTIAPGLAKPIIISKYRYNQHLRNGAMIIEVGGDGNTVGECLESTKYLAQALNDVINNK